ncbi:hypothetical protein KIL84_014312 [Mauremys mutica]|uniref:Uncharacterized protein n=1 Tax=Mauremys mutica TaxID=74926 RepID=A0A9D3XQG5_9SAUR|nr:hypothetical protein KIL84_014312 [Mauremys mutica]
MLITIRVTSVPGRTVVEKLFRTHIGGATAPMSPSYFLIQSNIQLKIAFSAFCGWSIHNSTTGNLVMGRRSDIPRWLQSNGRGNAGTVGTAELEGNVSHHKQLLF